MNPATRLTIIRFPEAGSTCQYQLAAPLYNEMAALTAQCRELLRKSSGAINGTAILKGFAPIGFLLEPLSQTAALLAFPSHDKKHEVADVVCVLLNGLESAEDMALIKSKVQFPPEHWKQIETSQKPVVAAAFNVNNRILDPGTSTLIRVLGNVYFNMFGTNAVGEAA